MTLCGHFEAIGREQGREEGRKEGRLEGEQHIAIQLIKEGFSLDKIAKLTSLNKDMIIELEQHMVETKGLC